MGIFKVRPDLQAYASRFDVPAADEDLSVTFLGVATLLIDDGTSAILTDGFFSRPSMREVGLGRLAPIPERIWGTLATARIKHLDAVLPVHTHFDHALDSATVAHQTGAVLVGGESAANLGRGFGLNEDRIQVVTPGKPQRLGAFEVTHIVSDHCPPDRFPGTIDAPLKTPAKTKEFKCGEAWSILVEHRSGLRMLVQGSAGFVPGSLRGQHADVAYLGIGQLGKQSEEYIRTYWSETVRTIGARRVVLIHWDDFFHPLTEPLRALPFVGDNLDVTMRIFTELAAADGVRLHLPQVFRREDPWVGLG